MRKLPLTACLLGTLFGSTALAAENGHTSNSVGMQATNGSVNASISTSPAPGFNFFANGQYSDKKGTLGQAGGEFIQENGNSSFGLGVKAVMIRAQDREDGGVLAIGGHYDYQINDRLSTGAEFYYSPDMLSFHHVDKYLQYGAKVGYGVVDNVIMTAGWRHTEFGYSNEDTLDYENNFYVGSEYRF
ncbi:YfaZ family outer membrane protein [Celerinatantimonas sp. YJH-8]|uniref:YfaZ family outer membrane protein n=1 Tax=Celerinatantimonas sp. YJH-8 TaxID=3228714 RepID=UPI0038BF4F7B